MGESVPLAATMKIFFGIFSIFLLINYSYTHPRQRKQLSLFSVVQFPNDECVSTTSSITTMGTCLTSSECTNRAGATSGTCASGFGVCCVVSTSTCGASVSSNVTYIRNPGYPSVYTPTSAGTCSFTINKESDDICQLRHDFQTLSGYTATTAGVCTAKFEATGQTGKNPPAICGTNTDYHMYVEFGASSTDSITLQHTLDASQKSWNILARQIACTSSWKAPTDCTQYFTGVSGNVQSYSYGQLLNSMYYTNCIRTEAGYCSIQWKQSTTTSPDPFGILGTTPATTVAGAGHSAPTPTMCTDGFITIPGLSMNGHASIPVPLGLAAYQSEMCGIVFGVEGQATTAALITSKQPFILGVYTDTTTAEPGTGFNLDYTQLPC